MKKQAMDDFLLDCLSNSSSDEWQNALASRLESTRAWLDSDEWKKGVSVYLRAVLGKALAKLLSEQAPMEQYHYARGFVAALRLMISFPASIEAAIEQAAKSEKTRSSPGSGQYTG